MAVFILVHGTFARNAPWTTTDSPLCTRLRGSAGEHGQSARFIPIEWSGKNLGRDRLETAKSIAHEIESSRSAEPDQPIFLIGHSHGGSAIAYFLKNFPDLRDAVAGCAFLSTPFVALRVRPLWAELLTALVTALGTAVLLLAVAIAAYAANEHEQTWTLNQAALAFAVCFVPGVVAATWIWIRVAPRIKDKLYDSLSRRVADGDTADIPVGHNLFLRASGDEAAALLAASQFVAWVMGTVAEFSSALVLRIRALFLWVGGSIPGLIALFSFFLLFSTWLLFLFATRLGFGTWDYLFSMFDRSWRIDTFGIFGVIVEFGVRGLFPIFILLFFGMLAYSIVLILTLTVGSLTLRLFGWLNVLEAIFIDFSAEPAPYGQVNFIHIDWKDQGIDASGLSHSRTYLNPHALKCLAAWASERLYR
jgi:pimeloyl-ACP methyl ester carboxylesterase